MSEPTGDRAQRIVVRGALATGAGFAVRLGARLGFLLLAGRLFGAAAFGAYSLGVAAVESGVGLAGLSLKKVIFQLLDANAAPLPLVLSLSKHLLRLAAQATLRQAQGERK